MNDAAEAEFLAAALRAKGARLMPVRDRVVSAIWPMPAANASATSYENAAVELAFFLRNWAAAHPQGEPTVLDERPLEVADEFFRRAS